MQEKCYTHPAPLVCKSDLKGLAEIYVIDSDFISFCGLDLHLTSFAIPGAGKAESATAFQPVASQRISVFATTFDVLKYFFFFFIRTEATAFEHFTEGNFVEEARFMNFFLSQ